MNKAQIMVIIEQHIGSPINGLFKEKYTQLMSLLNLEKDHVNNLINNFVGMEISLFNDKIEWIFWSSASSHTICPKNVLHDKRNFYYTFPANVPYASSILIKTYGNATTIHI